jgi:hypothetical protein
MALSQTQMKGNAIAMGNMTMVFTPDRTMVLV